MLILSRTKISIVGVGRARVEGGLAPYTAKIVAFVQELGLRPGSVLHIAIYGALSPILLPGAYLYVRQQGGNHPNLAFGLVSLFLFAFLIRGTFTA